VSASTNDLTRDEYAFYRRKAYYVARRYVPTYPLDDMISEGLASLVTSLRKYDPASKLCLLNYVTQRMAWAMIDAARELRLGSRRESDLGLFYSEIPTSELDETAHEMTVPAVANTDMIDLHRALDKLTPRRRAYVEAYLRIGDVALASKSIGMSPECGAQHQWHAIRDLRKLMA
jgi:RNA polymerase sigma factor (sigma-70 family)